MPRPPQYPPHSLASMHPMMVSTIERSPIAPWVMQSAADLATELFGPVVVSADLAYQLFDEDPRLMTTMIQPAFELIVKVPSDAMEDAENRVDEFRDRLVRMAGWERVNFGVTLETLND